MAGKGVNRSIRLFVNGKEVEHSINNVRKVMNNLNRDINQATKGSDEYIRKSAELRKVTAYYKEMRQEITGLPTLFDKLSEKAKGIVAILGVGVGLQRLVSLTRQLISLSAELADKQADVRKTTGMTKDEVRALTQELDKLETRTSRTDLLSIAEEGGRIGIAKEDISAFVEAMNKANVALGDTFGSASEVANVLGKLRFLYKETSEMGVSDAYNKIGSALNELGANGVASEQNIAAFATRVGALPNAFKPSIADAMALGAAFEESGVNAEVAGRSYGILIQTAANDTKGFAEQMKMTQQQVIDLINTNPTEFFLQFANSLKGMDANGVAMANTLKKLGIGADGVNKIIGAAANNNDRFRESISLANQAMEEGTSLTDEYNVKNENLAATLEKIQKTFVEWIDSDTVQDFVEGLVEWFGALIGAIDRTDEQLNGWQKTLNFITKAIGSLIVVMISYRTISWVLVNVTKENIKQTLLYQAVLKTKTATMNFAKTSMISYGLIAQSLTGKFITLRAVTILFGQALKSIPFVGIASAIIGVISYFTIFSQKTKEAADAQKDFSKSIAEAHKEAAAETGKKIAKIDSLINVIKDEAVHIDNRKKAYEELIKIAPRFNGLLEDEKFNIEELNRVYTDYVKNLQAVARAKATKKIVEDKEAEAQQGKAEIWQVEREIANKKAELKKLEDEGKAYNKRFIAGYTKLGNPIWQDVNEKTPEHLKLISPEVGKLNKEIQDLTQNLNDLKDTQKTLDENAKNAGGFYSSEAVRIENEIKQFESIIDFYSGKQINEATQKMLDNAKISIQDLKAELKALGVAIDNDDKTKTSNFKPETSNKKTKTDNEPERRRKIAEELLKIEIQKRRELRDLELQNQKERVQLMEDGFAKEVQLLNIEKQERINKLNDELEDLELLRKEYDRRANEETAKGNTAGATGFRKRANELVAIEKEKNKTLLLQEGIFRVKLETIKTNNLKKQFDDDQKYYESRLKNLETEHNNELKSVVDLESAKQVLRDKYGYSEEELSKLKDFEKAKSKITLEQDKETYEIQSSQLKEQIDKLQSALNADDAFADTPFGRMFSEEQREQILEFLEELENRLSKINNPEEKEIAEENAKLNSFIDIFGFSADQWEQAFSNLDTMSGKLALVQMGVQAMSNAWNQFYSIQQRNMQRDLDAFTAAANRKKEELKKQLDEGYISESTYNAKIAKLDAEVEKRRADMEYKSAMAEWVQSLTQAAANTAVGVTAALAMTPPNFVIAGIVGGIGAVQTGLIAANKPKKPQGYFDGGPTGGSGQYDPYGRELADGPLHAGEYVIPEYLRRDPQIARMEDFIEARRRGGRPDDDSFGYSDGGNTRPMTPTVVNSGMADRSDLELTVAIHKLVTTLEEFPNKPIEAKLTRTLQVAKSLKDDIKEYDEHRNKNKR